MTCLRLIEESKMYEHLKERSNALYDEEMRRAVTRLHYITDEKAEWITVFKLDADEDSQDIEPAILKAFLNCIQ